MAHEIETMAFFGKLPWHGLGTRLEESDLYNWQTASTKAGLDWNVELSPMFIKRGTDQIEVPDMKAVVRSTDQRILGTVGARYVPLQNQKAFEWFQPFLDAKEAQLHTAGSLRDGSRVWVLAKLNRDPLVIAQGDEVEKFILLSHSHDGTLSIRVGFTPIRVVCANTMAMAHSDAASKLIRIKHTKNTQSNMELIRETMNLANQQFEATAEQYRLLARKDINQTDLRNYVKRVLKIEEADCDVSTRSSNIIEEIVKLAECGRGNDLESVRGTYWTAYNGVSEYLTYNKGRNVDNRMNSLWFGDAANVNAHALKIALEMAI